MFADSREPITVLEVKQPSPIATEQTDVLPRRYAGKDGNSVERFADNLVRRADSQESAN